MGAFAKNQVDLLKEMPVSLSPNRKLGVIIYILSIEANDMTQAGLLGCINVSPASVSPVGVKNAGMMLKCNLFQKIEVTARQ
jgi:hypothetical protein